MKTACVSDRIGAHRHDRVAGAGGTGKN